MARIKVIGWSSVEIRYAGTKGREMRSSPFTMRATLPSETKEKANSRGLTGLAVVWLVLPETVVLWSAPWGFGDAEEVLLLGVQV